MTESKSTARIADGLTLKEERFCVLLAKGCSQSDAARQAYGLTRQSPQRVAEFASRLRRKPKIAARIKELLRAARLEDLDSLGEVLEYTRRVSERALEDGNLTAAIQAARVRSQQLGMLRDTVVLAPEQKASDAELIDSLAKGDPSKAAILRQLLGKTSFDA